MLEVVWVLGVFTWRVLIACIWYWVLRQRNRWVSWFEKHLSLSPLHQMYLDTLIRVCTCVYVLVTQSCPTLCGSIDCSSAGSSVHGILQVRVLEWIAVPFSGGSYPPRKWTRVSHITDRFFAIWVTREAHVTWGLCNSAKGSHVRFTPAYSC